MVVTSLACCSHIQIAQTVGDFINLVPLCIALAVRNQELQFDEMHVELDVPFDADCNLLTGCSLNFML